MIFWHAVWSKMWYILEEVSWILGKIVFHCCWIEYSIGVYWVWSNSEVICWFSVFLYGSVYGSELGLPSVTGAAVPVSRGLYEARGYISVRCLCMFVLVYILDGVFALLLCCDFSLIFYNFVLKSIFLNRIACFFFFFYLLCIFFFLM